VSDVDLLTVEVNHHNEPELVPRNVEYDTPAHLVRMRVNLPNVSEAFPSSVFRQAVPSPKRRFGFRPLVPKLPELFLGYDVHSCHLRLSSIRLSIFTKCENFKLESDQTGFSAGIQVRTCVAASRCWYCTYVVIGRHPVRSK
jgi:hypothetical protein